MGCAVIGEIFDVDGYGIPHKELFDIFTNDRCPGLRDKPKIFFFQCCRGGRQSGDDRLD